MFKTSDIGFLFRNAWRIPKMSDEGPMPWFAGQNVRRRSKNVSRILPLNLLKLGFWDFIPFQIGIFGFQDLPSQGPTYP